MELSSPRFKALAVSAGFTFWFVIITSSIGLFTFETLGIFVASIVSITQLIASKLSNALDIFAKFNTKLFLGILFVFVISLYGIFFKLLKIDLLRLNQNKSSYWIKLNDINESKIHKQD